MMNSLSNKVGRSRYLYAGFLLVAYSLPVSAKDTEQVRSLAPFTQIEVKGGIELDLTAGKDQKVTVITDENFQQHVETTVKNGTLYIDAEDQKSWKSWGNSEKVDLHIDMQSLESITVSGAVDGKALNLEADTFTVLISGAANLKIAGSCNALDLDIKGAGNIDAADFKCADVKAIVRGAGNADVYASQSVDANVSGIGAISVKGNPKNIQKNVHGIGSIDIKE